VSTTIKDPKNVPAGWQRNCAIEKMVGWLDAKTPKGAPDNYGARKAVSASLYAENHRLGRLTSDPNRWTVLGHHDGFEIYQADMTALDLLMCDYEGVFDLVLTPARYQGGFVPMKVSWGAARWPNVSAVDPEPVVYPSHAVLRSLAAEMEPGSGIPLRVVAERLRAAGVKRKRYGNEINAAITALDLDLTPWDGYLHKAGRRCPADILGGAK